MEYYNNILCIEGGWLYKPEEEGGGGIMSKDCYDMLIYRKKMDRLTLGGNGRKALIRFDSLPSNYKAIIISKFGNPYETTPHNSFRNKITPDAKAMEYFSNYKLPDGRNLPDENIKEYCTNAEILNAVRSIVTSAAIKRKALGGSKINIWDKCAELIQQLDKRMYPHSLPSNPRRLYDKYRSYMLGGLPALIHKGFCNDNSRKVSASLESLILSLYALPNKPYSASVHDMYMMFLAGTMDVVDITTGEVFDRNDFYDKDNIPVVVSESTVWNYINDPKNRAIVDKVRNGAMEFNNMHRPHHHRHAPNFALSKISMDDRDLPRKMHDGTRVKAYYAYDVASTCVLGAAYSKLKDKSLFIDCMRDMFRFINKQGFGMPLEVEVEHHLVNKYKDDLMNAGVVFPFVRWCNPGNSQEKRAEHFNRVKKYGFEKTYQEGIGRFYAKLEANKPIINKVFDEHNNTYKEKTYSFDQLVADDREVIELYNNSLHPNQKRYPGMSRLDVLKKNQNPNLAEINKAVLTRHIGEMTETSIRRSQYVTVQHAKYQLSSPEILDKLEPNNYNVDAYYLWDENGNIHEVYIYQKGVFIDRCVKLESYNEATAEQTEADREAYTEQAKYVSRFDKMTKDNKPAKVLVMTRDKSYEEVKPVLVPAPPIIKDDWELDEDDYVNKALDY